MKFICPLIVVEDIERSRKFYETLLGQRVKLDFGENITFEGDFSIHLNSHYQDLIEGREIQTGGNGFELYFESDRIDQMTKRLEAAGVALVHPMREQPWRQKVIRFYDPDNHIIELGESMQALSYRLYDEGKGLEEISALLQLPVDAIRDFIESR